MEERPAIRWVTPARAWESNFERLAKAAAGKDSTAFNRGHNRDRQKASSKDRDSNKKQAGHGKSLALRRRVALASF